MTTDGTWHVAEGVVLSKSDQFKFRKDCGWDTNIGATGDAEPFVVTLDEELPGTANGKNLAVPEDGTYDLLVNPEANLYKVVVSLGGKILGKPSDLEVWEQIDQLCERRWQYKNGMTAKWSCRFFICPC